MAMTHSERQKKFSEESIKRFYMDLNIRTDADIIKRLDAQPSKAGYIKQLIRADIAKQKETE